jgi:hypothetical protein
MHLIKKISLCLMLAATVPVASCFSATQENVQVSDLEANRAKWQQAGIKNYRYTFQIGCFCTPDTVVPRSIEVRDGKVKSATRADGKTDSAEMKRVYGDMEYVFGLIERAEGAKSEKVAVNYDPQFGYPTRISIDYRATMQDDEVSYTVSNFEELK